jgi:hypothetical protein
MSLPGVVTGIGGCCCVGASFSARQTDAGQADWPRRNCGQRTSPERLSSLRRITRAGGTRSSESSLAVPAGRQLETSSPSILPITG